MAGLVTNSDATCYTDESNKLQLFDIHAACLTVDSSKLFHTAQWKWKAKGKRGAVVV